jgi:HMG (high mobility group) box
LSAYNLFFSEERERILKEIEKKEGKEGDEPEIEDKPVEEEEEAEAKEGDEEKPKALLRPLIPSQKKRRPHRKTHGKISFQQLARMVGERWKSLPEDERKYYQDLAQEDMKRQKLAMEEYYAKQNASKGKPSGGIGGDSVRREEDTTESLGHSSYNEV